MKKQKLILLSLVAMGLAACNGGSSGSSSRSGGGL